MAHPIVIGDEKWIIYNNVEKKILGKTESTTFSHPKSRSSSKEGLHHVLCLVGLERDPVL